MRNTIILGMAAFALAGCPDPNASTVAAPKARTAAAASGGSESCELKNPEGTGTCEDGRNGTSTDATAATPETAAGPDFTGFSPEQCRDEAGAHRVGEAWGLILSGRLGDLRAYCDAIDPSGAAGQPAGTGASPSDSGGDVLGGGCVWKGQEYGPGQSIRYTDGQIMSSDLSVFGQDFYELTGKEGPWQGCDCGSSSGTWQCI